MDQKNIARFLTWLKKKDPFVYKVVTAKMGAQGQSLAGWQDVVASIGNTVAKVGGAYMDYKGAKNAAKLKDAEAAYMRAQAAALQNPPPPQTLPDPNVKAPADLLRILQDVMEGKPINDKGYKPVVNPGAVSATDAQKVAEKIDAGLGGATFWLLPAALLFMLKKGR